MSDENDNDYEDNDFAEMMTMRYRELPTLVSGIFGGFIDNFLTFFFIT